MKRKGFTLVELLAVIVILAILMVAAGAGVMSTMNNSKINTFKNEMLTAINSAENMYSEASLDPELFNSFMMNNSDGTGEGTGFDSMSGMCVTLAGLVNNGYLKKDVSTYAGVILLEVPHDGSATKAMVWAHNSVYGINGIEKNKINKLKYKKQNNNESRKAGTTRTADKINGGKVGIVTNLKGIKLLIKQAYGSDIVGNPTSLTNNTINVNSDKVGGGTGNDYVGLTCINEKID